MLLSSVLHAHVGDLFPGMKVKGCYQFRVTRNSDLFVDDEEIDDLLRALEGELPSRRYNDAVRLEVADTCPEQISSFLLNQFKLAEDALYKVNGPVNLNRLLQLHDLVDRPELVYPGFTPDIPPRLIKATNIFDTLHNGDILLLHPFQSFAPVVDFLRQAAGDPAVLSIKQTLYRTGDDSAIVKALKDAARAGKEVSVVIELRARFDEEANIELASDLQEAGAHVIYGVVGYKTHAKMIMVVRREGRSLRRYVHLGTGNYHTRTARLYTDYGLLTADQAVGEDVNKLFHQMTGLGRATRLKKLLQSPFTLHKAILDYIDAEIANVRAGKEARIIAKMNALVEPEIIRKLYAASMAGVKIDLIIRGICCLRPGIKGVSDNIQVRSIIGRFLEHTRVFYFHNDADPHLYCASADWMQRNLFHRVEACFPIEEKRPRDQVIKLGLLNYLSDNCPGLAVTGGRQLQTGPARQGQTQGRATASAGSLLSLARSTRRGLTGCSVLSDYDTFPSIETNFKMSDTGLVGERTGLLGYTGFVGGTLAGQAAFSAQFNSRNIADIAGQRFDTVICAAAPGAMFEANRFPDRDQEKIRALMDHLSRVKTKRFILISSIAVLADYTGGDDETGGAFQDGFAYGRHRRMLEVFVEQQFETRLVARLPSLFGRGLRKNFIFDLLNPVPSLLAKATLENLLTLLDKPLAAWLRELYAHDPATDLLRLDRAALNADQRRAALDHAVIDLGCSATQFHNPRTTYQYYDMNRLWPDIRVALKAGLGLIHLAPAPLEAARIYARLTGRVMPATGARLHREDMQTGHAELWGRTGRYLDDPGSVLDKLSAFFNTERHVL